MTNTNKHTDMVFCGTCGTMLIANICPRCNPTMHTDNKIVYKSSKRLSNTASDNQTVHDRGVEYVMSEMVNRDIDVAPYNTKGTDIILDDGTAILVRSMSGESRLFLINGSLDTLNADYLIIVTNMRMTVDRRVYIMTMDMAKEMSVSEYCVRDEHDEYFIDMYKYAQHRNNYDVLIHNGDHGE